MWIMYHWAPDSTWEHKMEIDGSFTPQDFGEVELSLPPETSGDIVLQVTAIADGATRRRTLTITIQLDVATTAESTNEVPTLELTDPVTLTPTDSRTPPPTDSGTQMLTDSGTEPTESESTRTTTDETATEEG